jgi:hypothetical protein
MASKDTCTDAIASAISDMDDGTEVNISLTGTVSTGADGMKTITGCSASVEDESAESAAQEEAEKAAVPSGVSALAKKKAMPMMDEAE